MPPLPTLVCKQCGYVNEGERVYCHGCGAKLDRDVIAAAAAEKKPSREEKRREVKRIMSPHKGFMGRELRTFARMLAVAAVVAVGVCAVRSPEGAVPLDAKRELSETPQLAELMEGLLGSPTALRRSLGEKDVNAYMRNERFRKVPAWFTNVLPLQRVYVNFEEGRARLTVGGTLWGYALYAGWMGNFEANGDGLSAVCTGGFVGRLPVHPALARLTAPVVPLVVSSAERDMKLIRRLQSVEFSQQKAVFATRPAPSATPGPAAAANVPQMPAARTALPSPAKSPSAKSTPLAPMKGGFH